MNSAAFSEPPSTGDSPAWIGAVATGCPVGPSVHSTGHTHQPMDRPNVSPTRPDNKMWINVLCRSIIPLTTTFRGSDDLLQEIVALVGLQPGYNLLDLLNALLLADQQGVSGIDHDQVINID